MGNRPRCIDNCFDDVSVVDDVDDNVDDGMENGMTASWIMMSMAIETNGDCW